MCGWWWFAVSLSFCTDGTVVSSAVPFPLVVAVVVGFVVG